MYRHCLFCASDLGSNEVIEAFPVGRRVAFDPAKGRLWVVCRRCERWNLSPLEERWEALEELEREWRETRARVSTEHIGLARLGEGLELVRIGRPRRPEFAAWRYGDQFGRRRRKFITTAAIGGGVALGLGLGSVAIAGVSSLLVPLHFLNLARAVKLKKTTAFRLRARDGRSFELKQMEVGAQKIRPDPEAEGGWHLDLAPWVRTGLSPAGFEATSITADGPSPILTGPDAVHALSLILPKINSAGAGKGDVRKAVGLIEEVGSPEEYFRQVEAFARGQGLGYNPIRGLPKELRLGLEMAAHEDQERTALEGELRLLEQAWQEAEAVAAIADDLLLPGGIRERLARLGIHTTDPVGGGQRTRG